HHSPCTRLLNELEKLAIVAPNVTRSVGDSRHRRSRSVRGSLPNLTAGYSINCIHVSVVAAEVDHVVFEHRRRDHAIAGWKFPFHAMELPRRRARIPAGMYGVPAKHRLRVDRCHREKTREQNSDARSAHYGFVRSNTSGVSIAPCRIAPASFPFR